MKYICDHDLHIHSYISPCSGDKEQNPERILKYGNDNGLKLICLTDHFWDGAIPCENNAWHNNDYKDNSAVLPLPQADGTRFLFGCETDINMLDVIGITKETCEKFDFIIIPNNHLHMKNFSADPGLSTMDDYRNAYIRRLYKVFDSDLPLKKTGLAHLTCPLAYTPDHISFYGSFEDAVFRDIFDRAHDAGCGIELNFFVSHYTEQELEEVILRPYRIAKEAGCKFYFGSDAHHPATLDKAKANFESIVDLLELEESDKYHIPGIGVFTTKDCVF